jgi:hypothetical protein
MLLLPSSREDLWQHRTEKWLARCKCRTTRTRGVAFDLMNHIGGLERIEKKQKENREYWLKLNVQCHRATHGALVDRVLGKLL